MTIMGDMSEHKLRPIYDALDSRNFKLAIQMCNKHLKKQSDVLILQTLKAYALARSGKKSEALEMCKVVSANKPTDDAILQTLTRTLTILGNKDKVVELYSQAYSQNPDDEDTANHYFMALVRGNRFKDMQLTGLKMKKTFSTAATKNSEKYFYWSVMSIYIQARNATSDSERTLLFTLATRFLAMIPPSNAETLHFHLAVWTSQKDYSKALSLLETHALLIKVESERRKSLISLLVDLKQWDRVSTECQDGLLEIPDDWELWKWLILSSTEAKASDHSAAIAFAQSLPKSNLRGPYLARLVLAALGGPTNHSEIVHLVVEYYQVFGDKDCWFDDVRSILGLIRQAQSPRLDRELLHGLESAKDGMLNGKTEIDSVHVKMQINIEKTRYFLAYSTMTAVEQINLVNNLVTLYSDSLPLTIPVDERERRAGDDLILLASHILLKLASHPQQDHRLRLLQATVILEWGLANSKFNFQIRLLAARVYLMFGVLERAWDIIEVLDMKHIILDTLTYAYLPSFPISFNLTPHLIDQARGIYRSNHSETPEMLCQAYKFGSFSKILEFMQFRARLDDSFWRVWTGVRKGYCKMLDVVRFGNPLVFEDECESMWSELDFLDGLVFDASNAFDNREFSIFSSFHDDLPLPIYNPQDYTRVTPGLKASSNEIEILTRTPSGDQPSWAMNHKSALELLNAAISNSAETVSAQCEKLAAECDPSETVVRLVSKIIMCCHAAQMKGATQVSAPSAPELVAYLRRMVEGLEVLGPSMEWKEMNEVGEAVKCWGIAVYGYLEGVRALGLRLSEERTKKIKTGDLALLSSGLKSIGETFIRHIVTCRSVLEDIATIQIVQDYESKSQNLVFVTAKMDSELYHDVIAEWFRSWQSTLSNFEETLNGGVSLLS